MGNRNFVVVLAVQIVLFSCSPLKSNSNLSNGQYQNLFLQAGYSQPEIDQKIRSTYSQLFYGNGDSTAVFYPAGQNENGKMGYVYDANNDDVRSEGMSYGMMIAVQLNDKEIFDSLWNWSKTFMYHDDKNHPAYGFFGWSLSRNGIFNDEMPAPDGEEYFAAALYFASARWGNGSGIYNYKKQADLLTSNMRSRKPIKGIIGNRTVTGLNLFDEGHAMVRFTPDSLSAGYTDASYHLPAFYEVWALKGPKKDSAFWKRAADSSRAYFNKAAHHRTGLTPDYGNFDGSPWAAHWRPSSAHFSYDAWRSVMNWSMDWNWWRKDSGAPERSNRILSFFLREGINAYGSEYTLEGIKITDGHPAGLIACNAAGAMAADIPQRLDFVRALWQQEVPKGRYRYYNAMLLLLAQLHCSGNFKLYL